MRTPHPPPRWLLLLQNVPKEWNRFVLSLVPLSNAPSASPNKIKIYLSRFRPSFLAFFLFFFSPNFQGEKNSAIESNGNGNLLLLRRWDNDKTRGKARTGHCWWVLVWGYASGLPLRNDELVTQARVPTLRQQHPRENAPRNHDTYATHNCSSEQRASFYFCSLSLSPLCSLPSSRPGLKPNQAKLPSEPGYSTL